MGNFFDSLRARMMTGMVGRYGTDELNRALIWLAIVLIVVSMFGFSILNTLAFFVLLYMMFRMFSRNINARQAENQRYLQVSAKPREWWRNVNLRWANRKTTAYIKCPYCKKTFTLPKGKGTIRATCPHCHEQSVHKV